MSQIVDLMFGVAFSIWTLPVLLLLGFLLGRKPGAYRATLLVLIGLAPMAAILLGAATGGCWERTDCMTVFGMMLAVPAGLIGIAATALGMLLRHLVRRR